jgi:hypothetical protein
MNKISQIERWVKITAMAGALLYAHGGKAEAQYVQTNPVSNIAGLATVTDPNLRNPWGFSHSSTSPFWISDQGPT